MKERQEFYTQEDVEILIENLCESPDAVIEYIEDRGNWDTNQLFELALKNAIQHHNHIEKWRKFRKNW